jgi:predicted Zn-dependent protease
MDYDKANRSKPNQGGSVKALPVSDQYHVEAAKGWVLLHDRTEAHLELDQVNRNSRQHPEVLEMRWYLYAEDQNWVEALKLGRKLHKKHPQRLFGWLAHAHSLLKCKGDPERARKLLRPAAELFEGPQVPFGLACYSSLAGKLKEGRKWLARALEKSGSEQIEDFFAAQPDLEALAGYLQKLEIEMS